MTLELKIPPLAVALLAAACMWLAAWAVPGCAFPFPGHVAFSVPVAVLGVFIVLLGVVAFRRAGTTVNPMNPGSSSTLVVAGIYSVTRNPMYLGFLLLLLAWAIYLANVLTILLLPGFVWYMGRYQIEPEEKALASLFGQKFVDYAARVRRWI